ncbi:MAG: hypothetical protein GX787_10145 [Tissierellia bacterium]|nr:hypothetical protein [Tissierellia bacterium]
MNLSKKPFIITIIILVAVTGCTNRVKDNGALKESDSVQEVSKVVLDKEVDEVLEEPKEVEKPIGKPRTKIIDPFLENFSSEATAEDLATYIKDNIASAEEEEADNMIQWLIIYHDTINEFDSKMEEEEYRDVFFDEMGGRFNDSKVKNIENENVRNDFITLINSFLTIDLYDGYPVVETDWNGLIPFSSYLSQDFSELIRIRGIHRDYDHYSDDYDIPRMSKDIIILEEIIKNTKSAFIKRGATDLWRSLLYDLLLGSDDLYIDVYGGKRGIAYEPIKELRFMYPDSILKEILEGIFFIRIEEEEDMEEVKKIIEDSIKNKLEFGLTSNNYFNINRIKNQKGEYDLVEMVIPSDTNKQNRINNIIKLNTEEFIQAVANDKEFILEIESRFENDRYIAYRGWIEIIDPMGDNEFIDLFRTLDYIEEKYATLEDYLDADFNFIQEYLGEKHKIEIENLPEFQPSYYGIELYLYEENKLKEYLYLELKDLLQYFTYEKLIEGN